MRRKIRAFGSAAVLCGGALILGGCQHQATGTNGVPFPAPHAAPPVQTQLQNIQNDPHIPPAQKAIIESHIANGNGVVTEKTPAKAP